MLPDVPAGKSSGRPIPASTSRPSATPSALPSNGYTAGASGRGEVTCRLLPASENTSKETGCSSTSYPKPWSWSRRYWAAASSFSEPAGREPISTASASTWAKARSGSNFAGPSPELPWGVLVAVGTAVGVAVGVGATVGVGGACLGLPPQAASRIAATRTAAKGGLKGGRGLTARAPALPPGRAAPRFQVHRLAAPPPLRPTGNPPPPPSPLEGRPRGDRLVTGRGVGNNRRNSPLETLWTGARSTSGG